MLLLSACGDKDVNPNRNITIDDFASMRVDDYIVSLPHLKQHIDFLVSNDHDTVACDYYTRRYYADGGCLLWVDRLGIDHRADTLVAHLRQIDRLGFSLRRFKVAQIEADIQRLRQLDFDTTNTASKVAARLDYQLTKAYLRYVTGSRFGFVNPRVLLNRIDPVDTARQGAGYRTLFDVKMQTPNRQFFQQALAKVTADSVGIFLRQVQPTDTLYRRFAAMLDKVPAGSAAQTRIMVNMERSRWRTDRKPHDCEKYVLVNVPSCMLTAVDGNSAIEMKVGLGALATKTPLLTSDIMRIDLNPQWIIPKSIIRNSVVKHVGDSAYFARNNYFVRERSTGRIVNCRHVTADMLLSHAYAVVQKGGDGNSLGRIIFRFQNPFSVYLHHTSSSSVFSRSNRAVSHGCVRVERPFELAKFLLKDKDEKTLAKLQYSITARLDVEGARADTLRRNMIMGSKAVDPTVPLFITYYTLYPAPDGTLHEYPDIYGYDAIINRYLNNYR